MRRTSRCRSPPRLARLCGNFSAEPFAAPAGKRSAQHVPTEAGEREGVPECAVARYAPRASRAILHRRRMAGNVGRATAAGVARWRQTRDDAAREGRANWSGRAWRAARARRRR
jgi:hypothetical protein